MDEEIIEISDSDSNSDENEKGLKNVSIRNRSAIKGELEIEKLSYKSKLDELRSKVTNIKKRHKPLDEDECNEEESPSKKVKTAVTRSLNDDELVNVNNGKKAISSGKKLLPSFQSLSEASFEPVVKEIHPSSFEAKFIDDENPLQYSAKTTENNEIGDHGCIIDTVEVPTKPDKINHTIPTSQPRPLSGSILNAPICSDKCSSSSRNEEPILKVLFRDVKTARLFRKSVFDALIEVLAATDHEVDQVGETSLLELNIWEHDIPKEREIVKDDNDLFRVDTDPTVTPFDEQLPKYQKLVKSALSDKRPEAETTKELGAGSTIPNTCFNCDGNHFISECPNPINDAIVSKNRQKHMQTRKSQPKTSRYHIDEEQRFAHLAPGKTSDNLRSALGLKPYQLPRFIYRMRLFGYPPGWLEEIKITHSGITLINESSTGQDLENSDNNGRDTYDINKLIEYSGFNVPMNENMSDESRWHKCPSMHWKHSKEALIQEIGSDAAQAYKKKKVKNSVTNVPGDKITHDDMDIVEINDEVMIVLDSTAEPELLDDSSEQTNVEELSQPESGTCSQDSSRAQSPDLASLEAKKQKILIELEGSGSSSQPCTPGTPSSSSAGPVFRTPVGRSKSLAMGTPIIKSASPYERLPSAESFSKGISDHLNFENLPDATGKYEKMKDIINKVRIIAEQAQQDDPAS